MNHFEMKGKRERDFQIQKIQYISRRAVRHCLERGSVYTIFTLRIKIILVATHIRNTEQVEF